MKKRATALVAIVALLLVMASSAFGDSASQQKQADTLKALCLFTGTAQGYELDKVFTRAQGTAMLLRLAGQEEEAKKQNAKPAFADVKSTHWAAASIAYAYKQGYVRGVNSQTFAPERLMTGKEFLTLVLRLLGYPDAAPATAANLAQTSGLLQANSAASLTAANPFLRGHMVEIAHAALLAKPSGSGLTLLQTLVEQKGAIDAEAAAKSGLYVKSAAKGSEGPYVPEPGTDPMDAIEEAIKQKLGQ
ncbi:S-layer homology domain-containing protein [Paenibacillus xanthanilyticus]|uniref:S-layer homology domain-containing protein n=1 Tax=Paenibacillus xanthanilyticus TaxID=1783531 RepID=A0ABV8JX90_9BACL